MRSIVGTDFSTQAEGAFKVAASLAAKSQSPLALVHVVEPGPVALMGKAHLDRVRSWLPKKLRAEAARTRRAGIRVVETLIFGSPHAELVEFAKKSKAELIVVASQRQSPLWSWLGRSVAERTAQNATVPTLVVRDGESLLAWTRGERPLNVFVGYDFSPSADAALCFAAELRKLGPCRISLIYVSRPRNEAPSMGLAGGKSSPGNNPSDATGLERKLKDKCDAVFGGDPVDIRVIPTWNCAHSKLIERAVNDRADVILVGTSERAKLHRFWFGSVSRAVLRHAPMNVICVSGKSAASRRGLASRAGLPAGLICIGVEKSSNGPVNDGIGTTAHSLIDPVVPLARPASTCPRTLHQRLSFTPVRGLAHARR